MSNYYQCEKHYVGETGTIIHIDCGIDVSSATDVYVFLTRPDLTVVQRAASPETFEGSTNFIQFSIAEGDLNQAGTYKSQVYMVLGQWKGKGREFTIIVEEGESSSSSSSST